MFSEKEQKSTQEKLEQLKKVKEGIWTFQWLSNLITQRRIRWVQEHLDEMLTKYNGLTPEEQAYKIIFLDYMNINPEHSKMIRISPRKIKIESYNFCPYLEACHHLGLDTKHICKDIGEPSIQGMVEIINPNLRFSRNYSNIRPNNDFCEEYIELLEPKSNDSILTSFNQLTETF